MLLKIENHWSTSFIIIEKISSSKKINHVLNKSANFGLLMITFKDIKLLSIKSSGKKLLWKVWLKYFRPKLYNFREKMSFHPSTILKENNFLKINYTLKEINIRPLNKDQLIWLEELVINNLMNENKEFSKSDYRQLQTRQNIKIKIILWVLFALQ